ncbi:DUF4136 domain-containing protein [Pontiella agarivorans]|uniref:DUF4136 domain-containing protein n=1 Tax=Pontiella agarivorans TaxID=3038953 RepID=A0ABU5MZP1_9BACT|nr:DUF4136 domain-containing protein [Pontiella agarivorans]MDZ8119680.1 DUF4136 domain-containing protein [Pontiella agarivorans]
MKNTAPFLLILSSLLLAGCSSLKVHSHQTAAFDFGPVQTYEWVQAPPKILTEEDTYMNKNLQIALNNQLVERGWTQVLSSAQADLQIVYYVKLREQLEFSGSPTQEESRLVGGFTYNTEKSNWRYNEQQSDLNVYNIEVGTLSLLIYNQKTGDPVWTGTLETRLDRSTPVEKQKKILQKIARRITAEIPN